MMRPGGARMMWSTEHATKRSGRAERMGEALDRAEMFDQLLALPGDFEERAPGVRLDPDAMLLKGFEERHESSLPSAPQVEDLGE